MLRIIEANKRKPPTFKLPCNVIIERTNDIKKIFTLLRKYKFKWTTRREIDDRDINDINRSQINIISNNVVSSCCREVCSSCKAYTNPSKCRWYTGNIAGSKEAIEHIERALEDAKNARE
jgi:hypothetical protein